MLIAAPPVSDMCSAAIYNASSAAIGHFQPFSEMVIGFLHSSSVSAGDDCWSVLGILLVNLLFSHFWNGVRSAVDGNFKHNKITINKMSKVPYQSISSFDVLHTKHSFSLLLHILFCVNSVLIICCPSETVIITIMAHEVTLICYHVFPPSLFYTLKWLTHYTHTIWGVHLF